MMCRMVYLVDVYSMGPNLNCIRSSVVRNRIAIICIPLSLCYMNVANSHLT